MANICRTDYMFVSKNKEQLMDLKDQLDFAMAAVQSGRIPSASGDLDYDVLLVLLGLANDKAKNICGSVVDILDLEHDERGYHFKVSTADEQNAAPVVFEEIVKSFPDVSFVYREDEPGEKKN